MNLLWAVYLNIELEWNLQCSNKIPVLRVRCHLEASNQPAGNDEK